MWKIKEMLPQIDKDLSQGQSEKFEVAPTGTIWEIK